jgi:protein-S-isoprenylcysteine O-methyltransferase Ste14/pimeloyl-ACP methyl ester carboxylesterase
VSLPARALVAFLALPGLVAYVVPLAVVWPAPSAVAWVGLVPFAAGTALLVWTAREFLVVGRGTLAPWDPPERLVSSGPYRYSRNPMYLAVGLVVLGWAVLFRSPALVLYLLVVMIAFHVRIVVAEEPALARRDDRAWRRYVARTPRWIFPTRRALVLGGLCLAIALPLAGLLYEAFAAAAAARAFPAPGRLVDVGGRSLHVLCIGEGAPVVLFEASGWGDALSGAEARERIARRTTVCRYDRRGTGWSDAAPGVPSAAALAADLGVLQDRAGLQWPLVIVAASVGGLTAEMFARQYPERVAGVVLLDAASSLAVERVLPPRMRAARAGLCAGDLLARLGLIRLVDPFAIGTSTEEARRSAGLAYDARRWAGLCAMIRAVGQTRREFEEAPPFPDVPLVVLSASSAADLVPRGAGGLVEVEALRADNVRAHQELAQWSGHGVWREVPDSTHLIAESQPDAVVDAVFAVLAERAR